MAFINLKLLLKMLVAIVLFMVIMTVLTLTFESYAREIGYLAILLPLGLFAYVIYKFKKEGVVAVIYFLGSVAAAVHHNLIIGIVLALIAILLSIKWKIWPFSPAGKQTSS